MHLDRRFVNAGAFLVALGGVPFLVQIGAIDPARVADAWRIWPLLLVAAGVGLILGRTRLRGLGGLIAALTLGLIGGGLIAAGGPGIGAIGCGGPGGTPFAASTGQLSGSSASVSVTLDCGDLRASAQPGTGWSVSGSSSNGAPTVTADASSLSVSGRSVADLLGLGTQHSSWTVVLPTGPTLDLGVTVNGGTGHIDLAGATVTSLSVTANAGSTRIDGSRAAGLGSVSATVNAGALRIAFPAASATASITVNAGSVGVCIPPGVGLRVSTSGAFGGTNLASRGLVESDGVWTTPNYASAPTHIDLDATINAGSLDLDPTGGCS